MNQDNVVARAIRRLAAGGFACLCACLGLMASAPMAQAGTITVTSNADSGAGTLREAVSMAVPGDTIVFSPTLAGQTIVLTSGQILITKTLTIDGSAAPEVKVDGNNADRVFDLSAPMTMVSLSIERGVVTGTGAGINTNSAITLMNVSVLSSTATGDGGGVFSSGPAPYVSGGVVRNNACTSSGCTGGGISAANGVRLVNVHVLTNTSVGSGGGVRTVLASSVTGGVFLGNQCTGAGCSGGGFMLGGGVPLSINGTQFVSNVATSSGGGVYGPSNMDVADAIFVGNRATTSSGGGLYAGGSLQVTHTHFVSNTAGGSGSGGGAFSGGAVVVIGGLFQDNVAAVQAGGLFASSAVAMSGTQFIGNRAAESVALRTNGAAVLNGGLFQGNQGGAGTFGGAIRANSLILTDTQVLSNTSSGFGGGASVGGIAILNGGLFQNNVALGTVGGALQVLSGVSISGTQFISNTARTIGGAIYVNGGNASVTNARFERGTAASTGGLHVSAGALTMTNTRVLDNGATGTTSAGGVYVVGPAIVNASTFQNNATGGFGGGLYVNGALNLTASSFLSNSAIAGGGLYANSALAITASSFISNNARFNGGGLFHYTGTGTIANSLFTRNDAGASSGTQMYLNSPSVVTILHATVAEPSLNPGAAIYVGAGIVGITNTIIASHTTGIFNNGGAVYENYNVYFGNVSDLIGPGPIITGANSLTGDPRFVNPAADDYHIGPGSAARNMGTNAGVFVDFEGDARPMGAGFDVGYDELVTRAFVPGTRRDAPSGW